MSLADAVVARNGIVQGDPDILRARVRAVRKAIDCRAANLDRSVAPTSPPSTCPSACRRRSRRAACR